MGIPSASDFLADVAGFTDSFNPDSTDRPFRIGTVDPLFSGGNPKILFDGETSLSSKSYPFVKSYYPTPSDRVVLAPVGTSYLIVGSILSSNWDNTKPNYPFSLQRLPVSPAYTVQAGAYRTISFNVTPAIISGGIEKVGLTQFKVPVPGIYAIHAHLFWISSTVTGDVRNVRILVNGAGRCTLESAKSTFNDSAVLSTEEWLAAGDLVSMDFLWKTAAGSETMTIATGGDRTKLTIRLANAMPGMTT